MKTILLAQARMDIRQTVNYLRKENPAVADNLILAIQKSLRLIERNPTIGRPDPEDGTREWSIPNWPYIIPYRIKSETIEILRVWHTRRDRPETW
jgi:plasmid stabilization system protein ParE